MLDDSKSKDHQKQSRVVNCAGYTVTATKPGDRNYYMVSYGAGTESGTNPAPEKGNGDIAKKKEDVEVMEVKGKK